MEDGKGLPDESARRKESAGIGSIRRQRGLLGVVLVPLAGIVHQTGNVPSRSRIRTDAELIPGITKGALEGHPNLD